MKLLRWVPKSLTFCFWQVRDIALYHPEWNYPPKWARKWRFLFIPKSGTVWESWPSWPRGKAAILCSGRYRYLRIWTPREWLCPLWSSRTCWCRTFAGKTTYPVSGSFWRRRWFLRSCRLCSFLPCSLQGLCFCFEWFSGSCLFSFWQECLDHLKRVLLWIIVGGY